MVRFHRRCYYCAAARGVEVGTAMVMGVLLIRVDAEFVRFRFDWQQFVQKRPSSRVSAPQDVWCMYWPNDNPWCSALGI